VAPYILGSIQDRHIRFAIAAQAYMDSETQMLQLVSQMKQEMGASTLYFSCFNPTGKYKLNLSVSYQRDVAKVLMVMNKKVFAMIKAKEIVDRSQVGNQSCFRNERINGFKFEMS
jgi:lauroyl/myristoyl acyltransferase